MRLNAALLLTFYTLMHEPGIRLLPFVFVFAWLLNLPSCNIDGRAR